MSRSSAPPPVSERPDVTGIHVARVLIDSPLPQLDRLFDYSIPAHLAEFVLEGVRVRVPLRSAGRLVEAYVVETLTIDEPPRPLSELDDVVSSVPLLPRRLYDLTRRVADRAAGAASDIVRLVVPRRLVRVEKAWIAAPAPEVPVVDDASAAWSRASLDAFPGLVDAIAGGARIALDAPPRPVWAPHRADEDPPRDPLTVGEWSVLLGAAAVSTLREGRSAIIVTPDHRDQGQVEEVLARMAPADSIVRWDARQTPAERYRGFLRASADAPCIVVGNRSAVYAPVADLGLTAIWNDGDPLLAEPLAPYVHARDAALVRRELEGSALLFAGHTRSTDVERLVSIGWVRDLPAARRTSPRVILTAPGSAEAPSARIPSAAFQAVRAGLADGPVLVQVARPGFAPVLVCAECRSPARCATCSGPLHVRRAGALPTCRWCGRGARGWRCGHCDSDRFRLASAGSERTADELGRAFPDTRVIIADGAHPVLRVDAAPALVVATRGAEPIAEGGYRAILLLDGERMLLADALRIGESCVRWWSDAAALADPGSPVHLVGVVGPAARAVATWTQPAYARSELVDRVALRLPPAVRTAVVEGDEAAVVQALTTLREEVAAVSPDDILGPVAIPPDERTAPGAASDSPGMRALVRFDVSAGPAVAATLRSTVVADALRARKSARGRSRPRNTLRVRLDDPDPEI